MSNPNIVPHLDDSRSYIYCPRCEDMGHPSIEMRRDGHRFICPLQHELDVHMVNKLVTSGRELHMVKSRVVEQPSPNMVQQKIWVHPQTWARLQEKYEGRFLVTMDTFLNLLAEGNIMLILGEDVKKLREKGLHNAQQILAAMEGMKEMEETHKALIEKLQPMFNAASAVAQQG